jgi:Domain of unknown function (DUF4349)
LSPDLATALRDETPAAPGELRERIALIGATPPPPRRRFDLRRALLLTAPAAAACSLLAAVVVGVIGSSTPPRAEESATAPKAADLRELGQGARRDFRAAVPAPSARRARDVQASLRVLVDGTDDLSDSTQRALRTTRRLGGYLVTVDYGTAEPREGTATMRVRIPVSRVQTAVVQFSGLGRILAQRTQITDLQQRIDEITRQIRRAKGDQARIAALRRERANLNRRAAFATVDLALTTHEPAASPAAPGRFDRAVDDATGVLTAELAIAAYVLIVASPFLVLLAAALAGSRAYRRHADHRLLERA